MHHSKSKSRVVEFKVDFEKAYDRVRWEFILLTFQEFGFSYQIIALIM